MQNVDSLEKSWCWERLKREEKGTTEGEIVGWHHLPNGHEFEQAQGDGEGQGSIMCCRVQGHKELVVSDNNKWWNRHEISRDCREIRLWKCVKWEWRVLSKYMIGKNKTKQLQVWNFGPSMKVFSSGCCCQVTSAVSDSVQPHRWQPTRLCHPWDSPGKNTGVGCHFLLQCIKS